MHLRSWMGLVTSLTAALAVGCGARAEERAQGQDDDLRGASSARQDTSGAQPAPASPDVAPVTPIAPAPAYACHVAPNAERGFATALDLTVSSLAPGGTVALASNGTPKVSAVVGQVTSLDASDTAMTAAFQATLGFVAEEDVSGLPARDLGTVTRLELVEANVAPERTLTVYRLFAGTKQVGGSLVVDGGMGTACLPAP